ncbi:MAG: phage baseplate assembly protein V [Acidobacteriota bacterium]|nr:phage baseplate assembly protein V [Acidobacteriota bacterium]
MPKLFQPASTKVPRYYGKYRGLVLNNIDPLGLGRIMAEVPAIPNILPLNWCNPCVPYAGMQVGFYFIPPIGASVWIEFERGDPSMPIWCGGYWVAGQTPMLGPPAGITKILSTEFFTLTITDTPGLAGFLLNQIADVNTVITITGNPTGLQVSVPPALASMIPETGVTLTYPPGTIAMTTTGITATVPSSIVSINSSAVEVVSAAINVTGNTAVKGNVTVTGPVSVTGAVEIKGNFSVTGASSFTGDVSVTGQFGVAGPCSLAMP